MIKTPNNSPKGIYTHLSTMHKHLKAQIDEQKEVHEEKKEQAKAEKEKTLKKRIQRSSKSWLVILTTNSQFNLALTQKGSRALIEV